MIHHIRQGERRRFICLLLLLAVAVGGCATTAPQEGPRIPSSAIDGYGATFLARAVTTPLSADPGASGFRLLITGDDAFIARAGLAELAERSLDLQYYAIADDATATLLLYEALRASQRGVRVRVLVDDLYGFGRESTLARLATQPNVEVRLFNPFVHRGFVVTRLLDTLEDERLNGRMHIKLWIADNAAAVVGGRNLGDPYFAAGPDGTFADLDVLAAGPAVRQISASFDAYWNDEAAIPLATLSPNPPLRGAQVTAQRMAASAERFLDTPYARHLRTLELGRLLGTGRLTLDAGFATVVADPPGKARTTTPASPGAIMSALRPRVDGATRELLLVTPYFVPGDRGVEILCGVSRRGVSVRVLTNSLATTDVPAVHAGYAQYRRRLLACGVELHELRRQDGARGEVRHPGFSSAASLHAKAVVIDRREVLLGSMNLDPRSRLVNNEIGLLVDSAVVGHDIGALFDEGTTLDQAFRLRLSSPGDATSALLWDGSEGGRPITLQQEPLAGWWRRLVAGVLGSLVPQSAL